MAPGQPPPRGERAPGNRARAQRAPPPRGQPAPGGKPGAQPRPYPQDPPPAPSPAPPAPAPAPAPAAPAGQAPPAERPAPPDPRKDLAERIADEKKWRQSTRQGIQFLALQFQATRCDKEDILAGNDDPAQPLITCSTDHKVAYLLGPSIISGDQIENATSSMNQRGIGYVVEIGRAHV